MTNWCIAVLIGRLAGFAIATLPQWTPWLNVKSQHWNEFRVVAFFIDRLFQCLIECVCVCVLGYSRYQEPIQLSLAPSAASLIYYAYVTLSSGLGGSGSEEEEGDSPWLWPCQLCNICKPLHFAMFELISKRKKVYPRGNQNY